MITVDEANIAAGLLRKAMVPAQGSVLDAEEAFPVAATNSLDPRNACANTLEGFFRCARFVRAGGTAPDTLFRLDSIQRFWPSPQDTLCYPAASIIDTAPLPYEAHAFTPTALLDSWNVFAPDTVLWKTSEMVCDFQVDFWATDDPTREAIAARLPSLFNPGESRAGVMLQGDKRYFNRPVRATLMNHQRADTEESVYENERRLQTTVRCEIDVVHLRCAIPLRPQVTLVVEDQGD